jgi:DNA replication and repair protein RecF
MAVIARLVLHNFRNLESKEVTVGHSAAVIYGPNGAGKTNILEALSLLGGGRGLRNAKRQDMVRQDFSNWSVYAELMCGATLSAGYEFSEGHESKNFKINGAPVGSAQGFGEFLSFAWLTPEHDRLFVNSSTLRRKFIDRLVYAFYPAHSTHLNRYEKLLRERQSVLKSWGDSHWLGALEEEIALFGCKIYAARREVMEKIVAHQAYLNDAFPSFEGAMKDEHFTPLEVADMYREKLLALRNQDRESGMTHFGPHRSDLKVTHKFKNKPAEFCSTGEQKMLLLSLMLSFLNARKHKEEKPIVLLLDDIIAHLDLHHRMLLFNEIEKQNTGNTSAPVQTWITGTDMEMFLFLKDAADFIAME